MNSADIKALRLEGKEIWLVSLVQRAETLGRAAWTDIPSSCGIYVVYLPKGMIFDASPSAGAAIRSKTVSSAQLKAKWARITQRQPTDIVYIGKGDNLKRRIRNLARFGAGLATNHAGGEWMWQIPQIRSACVLIKLCPCGKQVPFEKSLLDLFYSQHVDWPLANRKGGTGIETWWPQTE